MNRREIIAAFTVSLGGLLFGYDLGALSTATHSLKAHFGLTPAAFGLAVSISLWGTAVGSACAGRFADAVGRHTLVLGCAACYAAGSCGILLGVNSVFAFMMMRLLCGVAIGGFTVACPLYLSELAPVAHRGLVVSLFQIQVGIGVVAAFGLGVLLVSFSADSMWRWSPGLGLLPSLLLMVLLQILPHAKFSASVRACPRTFVPYLGGDRLFQRKNTRPILLATSIALFNQLSGVNILLLYLLVILSGAGVSLVMGHRYTLFLSSLSLATTLFGAVLVDRAGRRPLLILGAAGMAICLAGLGFAIPHHFAPAFYLAVLIAYNTFFAFSQGAVVWVYLSELFPPGIRGAGQGYGSFVHWIANALLVTAFPLLQRASSFRVFYYFALMMAVQVAVVWFWYPETRGTALGSSALGGQAKVG